jgi:hypothetical protein
MTDNYLDDDEEHFPEENSTQPGKLPDINNQNVPNPTSNGEIDPLSELRQNLFDEEQTPRPNQPKPDLLHRMTGNLSSRRVPPSSREPNQPHSRFGVRTAGNPAPSDATPTQGSGSGDTVPEEAPRGRGTGYSPNRRWGQSSYYEPESENAEEEDMIEEEGEAIQLGPQSKVQPAVTAPLDPEDAALLEEDEESIYNEPKVKERKTRGSDDRKRLPSGFERQQQVSRFISYNPKRSFGSRLQELSPVEKTLGGALILAVIGVIMLIGYLYLESRQPGFVQRNLLPPVPSATPTIVVAPVPVGLRLPGGWSFQVGAGMMVDGKWAPTKSEWLVGTEVRRVIAIPWNKQIEAVVRTFDANDPINLEMNNGDVLIYKVKSVSYVSVTDSSILYDTHPSLAIILIRQGDSNRWVVIANP